MKKVIIAAAALLLACATSFAQMNVNLGYVNSTETTKVGSDKSTSALNGFTVGFGYSLELADDFYFTPGVNYVFLTGSEADGNAWLSYKGTVTEHYVNVPLTLSFDFSLAPNVKCFLFAGPTASIGAASTTKVTGSVVGISADTTINNYDDDDYKRFDIMLGGGLGIKVSDKYCFKVGYDYGLLNRANSNNVTLHRSQLTAGIAFLF